MSKIEYYNINTDGFVVENGTAPHNKDSERETHKEPLIRLVKRSDGSIKFKIRAILVYALCIIVSIAAACLLVTLLAGKNPREILSYLIDGNFGTERRKWELLKDFALLLGVSLGIVLAFRMKFWNLGGNGQILMGGLTAMACMHYLGKVAGLSSGVIIPLMIVLSLAMGALWAVIPAIFKASFKTNESLFTLMMNYVALQLVKIFIFIWDESGSNSLKPRTYKEYGIPEIFDSTYSKQMLITLVIVVVAVLVILYLKRTKQGYEISVVGESERTAKYVGINQKKVIIRTMLLSGAICGMVGMLIVGAKDYTITSNTGDNMGFTAIMTVWLANCDPIAMVGTCFFVAFMSNGMDHASTYANITDSSIVNLALGLVYFIIIACKFFIDYKVVFRNKAAHVGGNKNGKKIAKQGGQTVG